ncbi:TetR/AcrR family transcriptional regulator [Micromonospora cathayae]|uniref:TetR family transcriptional regulator C-terminal domain-containing protein n=1 Tax=Micromonospora cathayae TaxID=3028804 RepID=A0ABY7ZTD1_9ACTN|nr:TetR family transcriptional regulator C-terminal domain-containing protein [Micromonospora sp. HUAS 3]WDZ85407.1 TetR family transcriptional regulator C-terminal domain-containing protein [Micromonospora sp. HUAS 3]
MPKVVDHEERRRRLGAAACVVLSRAGVAGTTVRAVAAEAGMPLATAQHYLPTRELMVRAALAHLADRVVRRARRIPATEVGALETLRRAVLELVPLDAERVFEARVWLMLTAEALIDDRIGEIMRGSADELRGNLERLVDLARTDGGLPAGLDVTRAADGLATLLDGLTVRLLYGALGAADARFEVDAHLTRLASPR